MTDKIIPRGGRAVKQAMLELLTGFSCQGDDLGVTSMGDMNTDSAIEAFKILLGAGKQATVSTKFRVGDLYNLLGRDNPKARREALQEVVARFTENDRQTIRTCGWVAKKWPHEKRKGSHGWTYYIKYKPGDTPTEDDFKRGLPFFLGVETQIKEDGLWVECENKGGKRVMVRVPNGMYEPVKKETVDVGDAVLPEV